VVKSGESDKALKKLSFEKQKIKTKVVYQVYIKFSL